MRSGCEWCAQLLGHPPSEPAELLPLTRHSQPVLCGREREQWVSLSPAPLRPAFTWPLIRSGLAALTLYSRSHPGSGPGPSAFISLASEPLGHPQEGL